MMARVTADDVDDEYGEGGSETTAAAAARRTRSSAVVRRSSWPQCRRSAADGTVDLAPPCRGVLALLSRRPPAASLEGFGDLPSRGAAMSTHSVLSHLPLARRALERHPSVARDRRLVRLRRRSPSRSPRSSRPSRRPTPTTGSASRAGRTRWSRPATSRAARSRACSSRPVTEAPPPRATSCGRQRELRTEAGGLNGVTGVSAPQWNPAHDAALVDVHLTDAVDDPAPVQAAVAAVARDHHGTGAPRGRRRLGQRRRSTPASPRTSTRPRASACRSRSC